ncbi:MAG: hypothetical protein ACFFE6_01840 [Candidatus Thorarchaeota archaeon]
MRKNKISAITFAIVLCCLLTALLFVNTSFQNNDLSRDKILDKPDGSVLAESGPYVTLTFVGIITEVDFPCPPPDVFAGVVVGDIWILTYTFDAATTDIDGSPTAGLYRNPIIDMTLKIGSAVVSGTPGPALPDERSSVIAVNLGSGYADYTPVMGLPDASAWAQVMLVDEMGTPFADDTLPHSIPTPLETWFPTLRRFLLRESFTTQVSIMGTVEDIVFTIEYIIDSMIDTLDEYVSSGILDAGVGNSLTKKLEGAIDHLGRDNYLAASQKLGDFIKQANALIKSERLPMDEGQELIYLAQDAIELLTVT